MKLTNWAFIASFLTVAGLALTGCDRDDTASSGTANTNATATAPADAAPVGLILASAPADAKDINALKAAAKEGDEVTLRGRVGGREEPFVDGRAVFQLVDMSIKNCKEIEGDACKTPWDYCCEPDVGKSSATVQVVGADGKPLKTGLKGVGGLQPLAEVTVKGKVGKTQEGAPLVVNATGIHVKS
jgi:hypothetical protein